MPSLAHAARKSLIWLSRRVTQGCQFAWRHPRTLLALFLLCTVLTGSSLSKLKFLFSAEDMVGDGLPSADELASIKERFQDGTSSILLVRPPEGRFAFTPAEMCRMRWWYTATRREYPGILNSSSSFDAKAPMRVERDRIRFLNLIQLSCETQASAGDLRAAKRDLDASPWLALRDRIGQLSLVFVFTFEKTDDPRFGSFNPAIVGGLHESGQAMIASVAPEARFHWVGSADFQSYVKKGFHFSHIVNSLMIILLLVTFRVLYGTWLSGLIYSASLTLTTIWIFGAKALMGSAFDVLSSGIFLILGVSALEDFTFASSAQIKGEPWRRAIRRLAVPSLFTSLTTVVGFASLCISDLAIIRRFGAWCAVGTLLEWVMLFVLLPAVLPRILGKRQGWVDPSRAHFSGAFDRLSVRALPRWALKLSFVIFPLSIVAIRHLNTNDTPANIFPKAHPYNASINTLYETRGWRGNASLLYDGDEPLDKSGPILEAAARKISADPRLRGSVMGYESAESALSWLGRESLLPMDFLSSSFKRTLPYQQLVDPDDKPRATLFVRDISADDLQLLQKSAQKACPDGECHMGGDLIAYSEFATRVPKTLLDVVHGALLLVALIIGYLALACGQKAVFPHLIASAFWGPCFMVVVLAVLRVPMDFLKCIFVGVLVGMTGDNAVQFLFASKRHGLRKGIEHCGGSSIQTNLCMALTALMYLGSYFDPPKAFGLILASGLIVTLVGDLWLLNGYLNLGTHPLKKMKTAQFGQIADPTRAESPSSP